MNLIGTLSSVLMVRMQGAIPIMSGFGFSGIRMMPTLLIFIGEAVQPVIRFVYRVLTIASSRTSLMLVKRRESAHVSPTHSLRQMVFRNAQTTAVSIMCVCIGSLRYRRTVRGTPLK